MHGRKFLSLFFFNFFTLRVPASYTYLFCSLAIIKSGVLFTFSVYINLSWDIIKKKDQSNLIYLIV